MHITKSKGCKTQLPGYYILYIVTENTLDIVSSVRFKTGSQKEIQVVVLNKTEIQCTYQYFPPECGEAGGGGGGHILRIRQQIQSLPLGIWQIILEQGLHPRCFNEKTAEIIERMSRGVLTQNCVIWVGK